MNCNSKYLANSDGHSLFDHSIASAKMAELVADCLLDENINGRKDIIFSIMTSALFHDVGKISKFQAYITEKSGNLDYEDEWEHTMNYP